MGLISKFDPALRRKCIFTVCYFIIQYWYSIVLYDSMMYATQTHEQLEYLGCVHCVLPSPAS